MIRFEKTAHILAPAATVWKVMEGVELWPGWTSTITRITKVGDGPLRRGIRLVIEQPKLPKATWTVSSLVPGRGFSMRKGNLFLRVVADHQIRQRGQNCDVTLSLEFSGWFGNIVARKYKDMMEAYLSIEASGLKRKSETMATFDTTAPTR